MPQRTYKIRQFQNGKNRQGEPFINYAITVPTEIARELPDGMTYSCEMTNEGLLFRPVEDHQLPTTLPDWAVKNGGSGKPRSRPGLKPVA